MRDQIGQLVALGSFLAESDESTEGENLIKQQDTLVRALRGLRPATDQEACALTSIFGPDDAFGLAWSVMHFIETAPSWPLVSCIQNMPSLLWKQRLEERISNLEATAQQGTARGGFAAREL